ncbi:hypothetical protein [Nocardiopsis sp. SBT366]|uniref:hypothetical protein n=1 Tax=Nocardiopsis sp. SBT366 TaxID=1580529 RepID=UPI00066AE89D|nr:hypothetical protein [Nocardiopsis sp. SBT366]
MSLAEMEAYERERKLRRERIRLVVSWVPLGVTVLTLAVGGLAVWSASSGREADHAAVAALVEEHENEAEEAEAEFQRAWTEALERATPVRVERLDGDRETMHALLLDAVEAGGSVASEPDTSDDETLDPLGNLSADGVPALREGSQAELGEFDAVLVDKVGSTYSYFVDVDVFDADDLARNDGDEEGEASAVASLSVMWSTNNRGEITEIDAHWLDETPERS